MHRRTPRRAWCVLAITFVLTGAGCPAAKVGPLTGPGGEPPVVFAFIENGATTRARVLDQLGSPQAEFEHGRVLAYRLDEKRDLVASFHQTAYSLILVFDERGILERHALVRVR
jgi:hypothetical protein